MNKVTMPAVGPVVGVLVISVPSGLRVRKVTDDGEVGAPVVSVNVTVIVGLSPMS
jgi:hypothetical protein